MADRLELARLEVDGTVVLDLPPEVDNRSAHDLEEVLVGSINAGNQSFLLDLSDLDEISSGGLRVLLTVGKRLELEGGCLALCGLRPEIREVLEVARMTRDFRVLPDRAAGLRFLERQREIDRRARLTLDLLRERETALGVERSTRRPLRDGGRRVGAAAALLADDPDGA